MQCIAKVIYVGKPPPQIGKKITLYAFPRLSL